MTVGNNGVVPYGLESSFSYVPGLNMRWLDSESLVFVSLAPFVPWGICRRQMRHTHTHSPNNEPFETGSGEGHVARLGELLNWCVLRRYGTVVEARRRSCELANPE